MISFEIMYFWKYRFFSESHLEGEPTMNEWQNDKQQSEEQEIDILRMLQILWKRAWLIALVTAICGIAACLYSVSFITPTYRSSFTAYVNNRVETVEGSGSTTTSDLNASIALTYLYQDIIVSRSVLEDAADACGMEFDYELLQKKVTTEVSSDSALITVYVTDTDPVLATQLAAAIADVAPGHVERVRDGSSMRILDAPVIPQQKYAPSNSKNTLLGAAVGFVISAVFVLAVDLINDKVRDAEDLEKRYHIVAIGTIPDLSVSDNGGVYGYRKAGSVRK